MEKRNSYSNEYAKPSSLHNKCNRHSEVQDSNETVDENRKIISLYSYKRKPSQSCYFTSDSSPARYCEHKLDRRSRLYNYIMDEPCLTCQLPTESSFDNVEKPTVKSRYMDFYYKQLEEKKKQATCDDPINSNDSPKADQKSPSGDNLPACYNDEPSATHHVTVERSAFETTKPRYLDYLKNLPKGDETDKSYKCKKEPIEIPELDWKEYHRLSTIHNFLDELQYNFPSLCTTGIIGSSLENRDLKVSFYSPATTLRELQRGKRFICSLHGRDPQHTAVLKVSNSKCGNASVWIDAGIHAREWIAPAVNTYLANYIVKNFKELPDCVTNKDWYFLPVMNPDGYEYSHTNYRMWRKNKAYHGKECVGVDLNRNFSYGWGGKGSSDDPKSPFYRGPHPFSEPESRAVRDMLKWTGINFQAYVTLHSFGEVILFPYAYRDELCPDYIRLLEGATAMSKAIHKISGNTYKVGISRDVMYGAAGTSCDWAYGEAQIPFCYLLELRSKKHKFRLPEIEIEETGKEILGCIMALMEFVDNCDEL